MIATDPFVIPPDVLIVPVSELPAEERNLIECEPSDFALTRPRSRSRSSVIDSQSAKLLGLFRNEVTIVQAVASFSRSAGIDPHAVLTSAFPLLQRLVAAGLLVPANSPDARRIVESLGVGDRVGGFEVGRCVQVLRDVELYQVRHENRQLAALKIARAGHEGEMRPVLEREAAVLRHLDGVVNPGLLDTGTLGERPYIAMEWCSGVDASVAASELNGYGSLLDRARLLDLCYRITAAYAHLHTQGVIHSDIHERNILVDAGGRVRILDYGLSTIESDNVLLEPADRGGIDFYLEPEYAESRRAGRRVPNATMLGEQYSLAAMLYSLFTGAHYIEFATQKKRAFSQICEETPLPFAARSVEPWPHVERVLAVAFNKQPQKRFASMAEFAQALRSVALPAAGHTTRHETWPPAESAAGEVLQTSLARAALAGPLLRQGLPSQPTCSVNNGAAGIAYALYRIAMVRDDAALLSLADVWATKAASHVRSKAAFRSLDGAISPATVGRTSLYHTVSGLHLVRALIAHARGDLVALGECCQKFMAASRASTPNADLTLGRSGTVLGCALLLDVMSRTSIWGVEPLKKFGNKVLRGIWAEVDSYRPIRECSEITYLGIAHGWGGLLYATTRWCQSACAPIPSSLVIRLRQLAEYAEPYGRGSGWRWTPGEVPGNGDGFPSSWCNGTSGLIHLWTLAHDILGDEIYLDLARGAAWTTWDDDDSEMFDLCCGLAGRAYSLLNLYRHTGELAWLDRAKALAERAAEAVDETDENAHSLYKGGLGVALLVAELEHPEAARMPLFEQEGWPLPQ